MEAIQRRKGEVSEMHKEKEMTTTKPPTTEEALEPCPFCGAVPVVEQSLDPRRLQVKHGEYCVMALNEFGRGRTHYIEYRFRKAWNRRISPASAAPVVDELREELALLFGAYHAKLDHQLPAVECSESECVRMRGRIYAASKSSGTTRDAAQNAAESIIDEFESVLLVPDGYTAKAFYGRRWTDIIEHRISATAAAAPVEQQPLPPLPTLYAMFEEWRTSFPEGKQPEPGTPQTEQLIDAWIAGFAKHNEITCARTNEVEEGS